MLTDLKKQIDSNKIITQGFNMYLYGHINKSKKISTETLTLKNQIEKIRLMFPYFLNFTKLTSTLFSSALGHSPR